MSDDSSPPAAILTQSQRAYLRGENEPANEYMMQKRIRERVFAALHHDGKLLSDMSPEIRREIFREWENLNYDRKSSETRTRNPDAMVPDWWHNSQFFKFGVRGLLKFIYSGVEESGGTDFWEILEGAINRAVRERGRYVENFEYEIEFGKLLSIKETYEMFESGEIAFEELTHGEIGEMLKRELLDPEEIPDKYSEE
jgi:hypothetical protein